MLLATLILCAPLAVIVTSVVPPYADIWPHLLDTVIPDYIVNSLILALGVGVGTFVLGASTAWLTAMCQFRGSDTMVWALLLPMAMPAYIIAYTYTGMLDFAGPVQSLLRASFAWRYGDYWFPEIRSLGGAICMLSLVLYPYVYLLVRASLLEQSRAVSEVSRSLGHGPWRTVFFAALPLARPAIVAGVTLALMETLADYGTVQYFGVSTFTTGIFRTWFGMGEPRAAAQLASMLLVFVVSLITIERLSRRRMRFHHTSARPHPPERIALKGRRALLALLCCMGPVIFGFVLPATQLVLWLGQTWRPLISADFLQLVLNSFTLAALAAACCLVMAVIICFGQRIAPRHPAAATLARTATLGYAVPGTVIAVGVLIPLAAFDNHLDAWLRERFNASSGLLLSGSLFAVVFAYTVRFVSVAVQTVEAGYSKIPRALDDSARTLGRPPVILLARLHMPLLRTSLVAAVLLVFVDVLKELPTTLILRPFNFNTLAVRAYELAADERLADAAGPALAMVVVGLLPVIYLARAMGRMHRDATYAR